MTPRRQVLNIHNGLTNGKAHMYLDKQIHVDVDTIVSFVIQSGQVSKGGGISVSRHVKYLIVNSYNYGKENYDWI